MVSSCLKIIACGSDSPTADKDEEHERNENKVSPDKRGWSFRKKSTSQRGINNNTVPDTKSNLNKEFLEPVNFDYQAQKPDVSEKISVLKWPEEVIPLSTEVSKLDVPEKIPVLELPDEVTPLSTDVSKSAAVPEEFAALQLPDDVIPLPTELSNSAVVPSEVTALQFHDEAIKLDTTEKISAAQLPDEVTPLSTDVNMLDVSSKLTALSDDQENLLPAEVNSNTPEAVENAETDPVFLNEDSNAIDSSATLVNFIRVDLNNLEEPVAVVLQSAIRGYLAQRTFLKLKNVVKLQAAVRGLLCRRQAVGSLLCVQAIVKMQALVRARRARAIEGSVIEEQLQDMQEKCSETTMIEEKSGTEAKTNYSYTHKLLYNGFARQLLESTPKKKQIRIKCDSSRPDSSWKWFDRWTTVSSSKYTQPQFSLDNEEQGERTGTNFSEVGAQIPDENIHESADLMFVTKETTSPIDAEENLINHQADDFDFQVPHLSSREPEISLKMDTNETEMQTDAASQTMSSSIFYDPEKDCEQQNSSARNVESEQVETEDKKLFGCRKACNPAFIAAKSKFEDLSLRTISGRSINQDNGLDMDNPSFPTNTAAMSKEQCTSENSISYDPKIYAWGSECGTELSISSTLDSPDRFANGGGEFDCVNKVLEKVDNLNGITHVTSNLDDLDIKVKNGVNSEPVTPTPVSTILHGKEEDADIETVVDSVTENPSTKDPKAERTESDVQTQLEAAKSDELHRRSVDGPPGNNIIASELNGTPTSKTTLKPRKKDVQKLESIELDVQTQLETTSDEPHRSSLDGSPGNNTAASELTGTPTSKGTLKPKRKKVDRKGSPRTKKSLPAAVKKSPAKASPDSGARSSTEQMQKDPKSGKKRSSLGPERPDHVELEARVSISSSNALPSYMQATQSAIAKAHVNNSPRSRPDVQDKDVYIKKRHSLPANGKQGSPRVDPSTSQRNLGANGSHTRSPW
ncbi:hypothetical protein C5167_014547 [Papaver somniferum]|uniref:DUF4005 domain-containing protein n=2 Tax=Papaver somniferum TaxID=3469 RepID=A0A4Y7J3J2_PAPSO|nr:hypothetical protein C5167_014547 [Papaver somniferum]